jgi:hypothetical protein
LLLFGAIKDALDEPQFCGWQEILTPLPQAALRSEYHFAYDAGMESAIISLSFGRTCSRISPKRTWSAHPFIY